MNCMNNSFELEQRVLETLMHYGVPDSLPVQKSMLILTSDCFYTMDCKRIFRLIRDCFNKQEVFNFVDILCLISKQDKELHSAVTWMIDNYCKFPPTLNSFSHDVDRLILLSTLRKQIHLAEKAITEVKACPKPEDAKSIWQGRLSDIGNLTFGNEKQGITNDELAEAYYNGTLADDLMLPTTCKSLNEALGGGIMSKSLVTVAAGAGVGKTGFSIFLLDAIARNLPGTQTLFFSLEMESKHIWTRKVGICSGTQFNKLSDENCLLGVASSLEVPMTIYDANTCRNAADLDFILTTSRLKAQEMPISVIVVDYLGLVENHGIFERNDLRQSDITSKLAKLALELNCVVIALSQINRSSTSRAKDDQCPYPSDAADSSGSHRSSTLWLGVDRPELYQDDPSYKNQFVVKCRKNRFGGTFELVLAFNEGTFSEVQTGYFKKPYAKANKPQDVIFGMPAFQEYAS